MSRPAVVVENLTKVYRIGQLERRSDTLVGAVAAALKAPLRNFHNLYRLGTAGRDGDADDTIRAVDDVSFEVPQGQALGIIGRNGAGKSTLLKILSRVTQPTSGRVRMRGRVSSLLEVGTGFHPELTGRENVYLNGTILGMTKREIDRKFDEIVDFSGVEKFLDTPVKRYSSGMKVRLAFAVAAHLEPEILIIDEVLAVGDAEFQNKCLGKMREIAGGRGRTVLFVSHNMAAVASLCQKAMVLERGRMAAYAGTGETLQHYMRQVQGKSAAEAGGSGDIDVRGLEISGDPADFDASEEVTVSFTLRLGRPFWELAAFLMLHDAGQNLLVHEVASSRHHEELGSEGTYRVEVRFPPLWLAPGQYSCHIKVVAQGTETKQRFLSLPIMLTVAMHRGPKASRAVLTPSCRWSFRPA